MFRKADLKNPIMKRNEALKGECVEITLKQEFYENLEISKLYFIYHKLYFSISYMVFNIGKSTDQDIIYSCYF